MSMPSAAIARRSIRLWWVLAIAAALTLLGHDGLMAAGAHATPAPAHHDERAAPGPPSHEARNRSTVGSLVHASGCAVISSAQIRTNDLTFGSLETAAVAGVPMNTDPPSSVMDHRTDPTWSPGTRRAFLQVYRI